MQKSNRLVVLIALAAAGCGADGSASAVILPNSLSWGFENALVQQVREATECESGWTELKRQLDQELDEKGEPKGNAVPIQPKNIPRFKIMEQRTQEQVNAAPILSYPFSRVRESLEWPCWGDLPNWRARIRNAFEQLQDAGYVLEITLAHHDSYPVQYHDATPGFGIPKSGWANEDTAVGFASYARSVTQELNGVLPRGTRVYLFQDPVPEIVYGFIGTLDLTGPWPPGGKRADASAASAMRHVRDAIHETAAIIADAGWETAIAQNLRFVEGSSGPDADRLNYIYNWWLLDAIVNGCIDNDFDGSCEQTREPSRVDVIGVTFYGTMWMIGDTISLAAHDAAGVTVHLGLPNFKPRALEFRRALQAAHERYPNSRIVIAEIGLSSENINEQEGWLRDYRDVAEEMSKAGVIEGSMLLHTMFKSAEFNEGKWFFEAVGDCATAETCRLTDRGEMYKRVIEEE